MGDYRYPHLLKEKRAKGAIMFAHSQNCLDCGIYGLITGVGVLHNYLLELVFHDSRGRSRCGLSVRG